MILEIIAWIVLGAIAGYIAGFLVRGDEGLGVIGHITLGIVGAFVGGILYRLLTTGRFDLTGSNDINLVSVIVAVIGAIIVVVAVGFLRGGSRAGRGSI